jgi:hypothetical protein
MTLPKSVLGSVSVSGASAAVGLLEATAALVLAPARVLPRVCADGWVVFWAEEVPLLLLPLPDWPLPLAAPVPGVEPLLLPELASLAWLAARLVFGLSATLAAEEPAARG